MDVYWFAQTAADVPAGNDWLNPGELARLEGMRFPKRRDDWRLGRWTAKCAVAARFGLAPSASLAAIEIRSAPSGAPEVYLGGEPAAASISLSHRCARAMCAIAERGTALGCDLEFVEPRSGGFAADYFTPAEQCLVSGAAPADRDRLLALLWSAKESALKALGTGLRIDTRGVSVEISARTPGAPGWSPLLVRAPQDRVFRGWWQSAGDFVRTLAADPAPGLPARLPDRPVSLTRAQ